jgi:hypothetical protein
VYYPPVDNPTKNYESPLETKRAMNDDLPAKDHKDILSNNFPPVGKTVMVWNEGRELMAYLDKNGEWRNHLLGYVLAGQVKVLKPDEH